jgi:hypothetical protein
MITKTVYEESSSEYISISYAINSSMREEDDMTLPPLPPLARHPSDMREWRSLAYYNCAICNRVGADYIINVPEESLPTPVCSSCYFRTLNNKTVKKKKQSSQREW